MPNADYARLTYVSADDWAGIYVDGQLIEEGHSILPWTWLDLLKRAGVQVLDASETPEAYAKADELGRFPGTDEWVQNDSSGADPC